MDGRWVGHASSRQITVPVLLVCRQTWAQQADMTRHGLDEDGVTTGCGEWQGPCSARAEGTGLGPQLLTGVNEEGTQKSEGGRN